MDLAPARQLVEVVAASFRRARGVIDFLMATLCLWGAYHHTPLGAAVRDVGARIFGVHSSAGPLLSYYTGGAYDGATGLGDHPNLPPPLTPGPLSPADAEGFGTYAVWKALPLTQREPALTLAQRYAVSAQSLEDAKAGPFAMKRLLEAAERDDGSPELAVTAVFAGDEPARYVRDQLGSRGPGATLADIVRELPPGFEDAAGHASMALSLGTAYGLAWPLPASTAVTSPFGWRDNPVTGQRQLHTGVDLGVPEGTWVHAVADGTVRRANADSINGRVVVIDHGHGVSTAYCHNSELLVSAGEVVHRGQVIARSGTTGRSTGPHVHYQLQLGDEPVDPFLFRVRPQIVARDFGPD